jgi:hypothetical protein
MIPRRPHWWIERRAARIADPVERLRYLRSLPARGPRRPIRFRGWPVIFLAPVAFLMLRPAAGRIESAPRAEVAPQSPGKAARSYSEVWNVQHAGEYDIYSNGLRIENRLAAPQRTRSYLAYPIGNLDRAEGERRSDPAGIVFHSSETQQAPFTAEENSRLQLIGESLVEYVRARRAYNFVVDRFGRVYRVVPEEQAANHAGHSVWADDRWLYVDLNYSFLGVAFESRTEQGGAASPAQLRAGAMLTEMLASRYRIAAADCVTHAQVSVNPGNMRMGWHTDWAAGFPFEQVGLPDNYAVAPAAIWACGFAYDPAFLRRGGERLGSGLVSAEDRLERAAARAGKPVTAYRKILQHRYAALRGRTKGEKSS